jgi:polysaccharide pyruvyl transferase WcaK-like protein
MSIPYKIVGLFDHMGFGNMGDAAILEAFIANIRKRLPNAHLVAFSLYPDDTRERHGLACYPIRWWYPGWKVVDPPTDGASEASHKLKSRLKKWRTFYALAKAFRDCLQELAHLVRSYRVVRSLDLLIVSGGGQLCELYGDLPYNVFKFCVLAKVARTPVFIVGVGADLLQRPANKFLARWSVRLANYVSFRSVESQALVRSLGVKRAMHVCPDPVYSLDLGDYLTSSPSQAIAPGRIRALLRQLGVDIAADGYPDSACGFDRQEYQTASLSGTTTPRVGINPISFCDPRRWPRKDATVYDRYLSELTAFSLRLLAQNYHLEIFTSDIMDIYALEDLRKSLLNGASSEVASRVTFRPVLTLRELLLQMSTFDFVVTSKFHGVIFSHLLGKPVIALSYLPKISHLMRRVGHERYCADAEHFDADWLIERFQLLVYESDQLRSLFGKASAAYAHALQAEFDKLFLPKSNSLAHEGYSAAAGSAGAEASHLVARQ